MTVVGLLVTHWTQLRLSSRQASVVYCIRTNTFQIAWKMRHYFWCLVRSCRPAVFALFSDKGLRRQWGQHAYTHVVWKAFCGLFWFQIQLLSFAPGKSKVLFAHRREEEESSSWPFKVRRSLHFFKGFTKKAIMSSLHRTSTKKVLTTQGLSLRFLVRMYNYYFLCCWQKKGHLWRPIKTLLLKRPKVDFVQPEFQKDLKSSDYCKMYKIVHTTSCK